MLNWHYFKRTIPVLVSAINVLMSCNKNNFLDKKPSSDLVIPKTLEDCRSLLDNYIVMQETPELGELSADNFYLNNAGWQALPSLKEQNAYIWASDIYGGKGGVEDWDDPYQQVFYANVVLKGLTGIPMDGAGQWKDLEGSALFIRAYAFYNLAQVFAGVYRIGAANADPGIPLRLSPDIDQTSTRANLNDTYKQILLDLKRASGLLTGNRDIAHLNRPSKPAVLAMLARVCLSMGDYDEAGAYADSCLKIYCSLIDYNKVPDSTTNPFVLTNAETLYQSHLLTSSGVLVARFQKNAFVDSNLYRSYADSDLRKVIFYDSNANIKDSYSGSLHPFSGLATDEVYLIRAECYARHSDTVSALNDMDSLMVNRWIGRKFIPYIPGSPTAVLNVVLTERRKELVFRGLRWTDLRRLNADGANITLTRYLNMKFYSLGPTDQRYILPIPPDVSF
jgi:starch-binding outer membrane protein, SusD/RagB family